jgi:hypothetical protein
LTLDGDPVSWLVLEGGWGVVVRDGDSVGTVAEVIGDKNIDIFDGLAVSTGLVGKPRYVPAEHVELIVEGAVQLALTKDEFDALPDWDGKPHSELL